MQVETFQFFHFPMALDDSLVQGGGASLKFEQLHGVAGFRHGERNPVAMFSPPNKTWPEVYEDLYWAYMTSGGFCKTAWRRFESLRRGASELEQCLSHVRK